MDQISEYYIYASTVFLFFTFVFSMLTFVVARKILGFFSNRRFRISSVFEIEPTDNKSHFKITFFNNNVQDLKLLSFGFIYKNQNIDFYKSYLDQNNLTLESKVVVSTKDSIYIDVDYLELKTLIQELNVINDKIYKLEVFTTDSMGTVSKTKAKTVRKILKMKFKDEKIEKQRIELNNKLEKIRLKNEEIQKQKSIEIEKEKQRVAELKIKKSIDKAKQKELKEEKRKDRVEKRKINKEKRKQFYKKVKASISNFFKSIANAFRKLKSKIFKKKNEGQQ